MLTAVKTEIGHPKQVERPLRQESLHVAQDLFKEFETLSDATDLLLIDAPNMDEFPEDWSDDEVVGRVWSIGDEVSSISIVSYDQSTQPIYGAITEGSVDPNIWVHAQVVFRSQVNDSEFNGLISFLGDGDTMKSIRVRSEYRKGSHDDDRAIFEFAGTVGLNTVAHKSVGENQNVVEYDIDAKQVMGAHIVSSIVDLHEQVSVT